MSSILLLFLYMNNPYTFNHLYLTYGQISNMEGGGYVCIYNFFFLLLHLHYITLQNL